MTSPVEEFARALGDLVDAAGRPTFLKLKNQCDKQRPPRQLSQATWSDWRHGKYVPDDSDTIMFLIQLMQGWAAERARANNQQFRPSNISTWERLYRAAKDHQRLHRGRLAQPATTVATQLSSHDDIVYRLVKALHRVTLLTDPEARRDVLQWTGLRLGLDWRSESAGDAIAELKQLARACLDHPGGLAALLNELRGRASGPELTEFTTVVAGMTPPPALLSTNQRVGLLHAIGRLHTAMDVAGLYERATGDPLTAATMPAVIADLEARLSAYPLFAFVELLATAAAGGGQRELRRWVDDNLALVPQDRHHDLAALRRESDTPGDLLGRKVHLLVRLIPDVRPGRYQAQAWIMTGGVTLAQNHEAGESLTPAEAQSWLAELINAYRNGSLKNTDDLVVEFFLPTAELDLPVHTWLVGDDGHREWLGARHIVHVRPTTRTAKEAWTKRWQMVLDHRDASSQTRTHWVAECTAPDFAADEWAVLAVICPAASASPELMAALIDVGAPVALWLRGSSDPEAARQLLTYVLTMWEIKNLPERVRNLRRAASEEDRAVLQDLVIVWDDPTRLPPEPATWSTPVIKRSS